MKFLRAFLAALAVSCSFVHAQTATVTPSSTTYSGNGGTVSLNVTLGYSVAMSALGFQFQAPAGWSYRGVAGANQPQVTPLLDSSGNFEFAFTSVPAGGASFSITLGYVSGQSGTKQLSGIAAIFRPSGAALQQVLVPDITFTIDSSPPPPPTAPSIVTQPSGASLTEGQSVILSVVAGGTAPLSYQWRKDGAVVAGATNSSLPLSNVALAASGSYAVVVTNGAGSVTSSTAVVVVTRISTAPQITAQPVGQSIAAGGTLTLNVSASGATPLSFQWRKEGVPISGATNANFIIANATTSHAGNYSVVVSNSVGSTTSNPAAVAVTASDLGLRTWIGNLGTTGTFALMIRRDGTGVFLGHVRASKMGLLSRDVTMDAAGQFRGAVISSGETASEHSLAGNVTATGSVTGTIATLGITFALSTPTATGPTAAFAGFYQAGVLGGSDHAYIIIGAGGSGYVLTNSGRTVDAGIGAVTSSGLTGALDVATTENRARITGGLNAPTAGITLIMAGADGSSTAFIGANDDARGNVEKLINISTRSETGPEGRALIAGFVVTGEKPKPVLIRAIGPGLSAFQLSGLLPAAHLEIVKDKVLIASADDWGASPNADTIAAAADRLGAFALERKSRDAVLLMTLDPGAYTAVVSGKDGTSGICLVEVYDATEGEIPRQQRIINISSRAVAGAGDRALIAGFVIRGQGAGDVFKRVLVRGAGPALAAFGVPGTLATPRISVHLSSGTELTQNSSWSLSPDAAAIAAASAQVGAFAFPSGSADAALIVHLQPGLYTAQVSGGNATGIALLEIYELP